ncbi:MAG TPA: hypothetical protein VE360_01680 [Pyrinomonadaceae bacterium]|nr:hypothetical protein [Pyrinomonadaceae bacterium]
MRDNRLIEVEWRPRREPLAPIGAAARGAAAARLAHRLLETDDDSLAELRGVCGRGVLVILGAAERLPWVEGITYLGRDEQAPALLMPTALEPSAPTPLLARAFAARFPSLLPCAVLTGPAALVPVAEARAVAREALLKWLGGAA